MHLIRRLKDLLKVDQVVMFGGLEEVDHMFDDVILIVCLVVQSFLDVGFDLICVIVFGELAEWVMVVHLDDDLFGHLKLVYGLINYLCI